MLKARDLEGDQRKEEEVEDVAEQRCQSGPRGTIRVRWRPLDDFGERFAEMSLCENVSMAQKKDDEQFRCSLRTYRNISSLFGEKGYNNENRNNEHDILVCATVVVNQVER
jgi:hypothetical protein